MFNSKKKLDAFKNFSDIITISIMNFEMQIIKKNFIPASLFFKFYDLENDKTLIQNICIIQNDDYFDYYLKNNKNLNLQELLHTTFFRKYDYGIKKILFSKDVSSFVLSNHYKESIIEQLTSELNHGFRGKNDFHILKTLIDNDKNSNNANLSVKDNIQEIVKKLIFEKNQKMITKILDADLLNNKNIENLEKMNLSYNFDQKTFDFLKNSYMNQYLNKSLASNKKTERKMKI